jgi:hypothetical protein
MRKLKMVAQIAGMAIVTAACGPSGSYQTGYTDAVVQDPAALRKIIHEGGATAESYCQSVLSTARMWKWRGHDDGHNVDGSDFMSGCLAGVQYVLKEGGRCGLKLSRLIDPCDPPPGPPNLRGID